MMTPASADANLLFGVLALQADLLDAQRFGEACSAWAARKDTPLADLLVERGWLTLQDRATVEHLVGLKLKKHAGDAHTTLAAVASPQVQSALAVVDDPDVRSSLAGLSQQREGHVLLATVAYQPVGRERYTLTRLHAKGGIGQGVAHPLTCGPGPLRCPSRSASVQPACH
jgi:hypothetical protein